MLETTGTGNDVIFVGIARLLKKRTITELSLLEADKDEYVTRHLVDGRIIFCDHRISIVAGYMAEEVSGKSAFAFMHKDDFRWTMIGLRQSESTRNEKKMLGAVQKLPHAIRKSCNFIEQGIN